MPTYDQRPWRRKGDNPFKPIVQTPKRHYYPDTRQDLIEIVQAAEGMPAPKPAVRACGSHWALSHAAVTDQFIVETNDTAEGPTEVSPPHLAETLYEVVPTCLSEDALAFFDRQEGVEWDPVNPPDMGKIYLYHVEAGMRIWELYSRLDAGDDGVPNSLAARYPKYKGPWAMATLGGAGGQTIVGAISTGTHGTDVHLPPIADAVQAIHLIGPEGKQYWIERPLPDGSWLVDDEKLHNTYPGSSSGTRIEILRDPDALAAVLVAAGRMGIIYSVVLRVVRQYALDQLTFKSDWATVRGWIGNQADPTFVNNRSVLVLLNPNARPLAPIEKLLSIFWPGAADHSCYVQTRTMQGLNAAGMPPFGREQRAGPNRGRAIPVNGGELLETIAASEQPIKALIDGLRKSAFDAIEDALDNAGIPIIGDLVDVVEAVIDLASDTVLCLLLDALLTVTDTLGSLLEWLDVVGEDTDGPDGGVLADLANWCAENQHLEILRRVAEFLFDRNSSPPQLTAISYAMMDIHNYAPLAEERALWGDSLEVFFNAGTTALVTFVDLLLQRVYDLEQGWLTGTRMAFAGYVSIRFTGRSFGLLAMQGWPVTVSLEIAGPGGVKGTIPFLQWMHAEAVALGGRVHWGQRNDLTMRDVETLYGATFGGALNPSSPLYRWRDVLSRLSHNGRLATFSTPFTKDRGLEIVQPKIAAFNLSHAVICGGSAVHAWWAAEDNPPGTVARIDVRKLWSIGPPFASHALDKLNGSREIEVPVGRFDLVLEVSYTYTNSNPIDTRTLTDARILTVWGVQEGDIVPTSATPTCIEIDGALRWGVVIEFGQSYSPDLLVDTVTCTFSGQSTWTGKRAGGANLAFSPMAPTATLVSRPQLRGSWWFWVDAIGCQGTPPLFSAQFSLTCSQA